MLVHPPRNKLIAEYWKHSYGLEIVRNNLRENRRNDNPETLGITHYCSETAGGLEGMPIKAKEGANRRANNT